jgi:hypothetical protein
MDLFNLMADEADLKGKALDRLDGIVALYESEDRDVQDEALSRAINFCGMEWGGYRAGLEALASRKEGRPDGALAALRLREEGEDPGMIIRAAREARSVAGRMSAERMVIVSRYGSLTAALGPTAWEQVFVAAASGLADEAGDPWASLAGWSLPWHPVPDALRRAIADQCPLPDTIVDARAEVLTWEQRLRELDILSNGPGSAALPTACAARCRIVTDLWRAELAVRNPADLDARLDFWATRGGDDGKGYGVILADFRRLVEAGGLKGGAVESTKERCRRLKEANPGWSLARIGQEVGISRQAVHKHLK